MLYNTYYYVLLHICIILLYVLRVFIFIIFLWKMWPFSRFVASILKRTLQSIKQVIFESSTYTVSWILGKNLHRRDYVSRGMCRCPLWKRWWLAISHRGILIEGSGLTFETMSDHLTVYRLGICGSGWQCSAHYGSVVGIPIPGIPGIATWGSCWGTSDMRQFEVICSKSRLLLSPPVGWLLLSLLSLVDCCLTASWSQRGTCGLIGRNSRIRRKLLSLMPRSHPLGSLALLLRHCCGNSGARAQPAA